MDLLVILFIALAAAAIFVVFTYLKAEVKRLEDLINLKEESKHSATDDTQQVDLTKYYPLRYDIPLNAVEFLARLSVTAGFSIGEDSFVAYYRGEPYTVMKVVYADEVNYAAFPLSEDSSIFLYVIIFTSPKVCNITCSLDFIKGIKEALNSAMLTNIRYDFDSTRWVASIHNYDVRSTANINDWYVFSATQPREPLLNKLSSFVYVTTIEAAKALKSLPTKVNYVVVDAPAAEVDSISATCKGVIPTARLITISDKLQPDAVPSRRQS